MYLFYAVERACALTRTDALVTFVDTSCHLVNHKVRVQRMAPNCRSALAASETIAPLWDDRAVIDDPDRNAVRSAVAAMLPASLRPWSIQVRRNEYDVGWVIDLTHEASCGFGLMVRFADVDEAIASATRGMANYESGLRRVVAAPVLTNPEAFLSIRTLASIFNWSRVEVRAVARMMEQWTSSPEEIDWLITWIGHDGGAPTPSRDF